MNNEMSNIIHFLETHKEDIINRWNDEMMKCPNDPLKGKIQENTNAIFFLFLRMLEEYGNDYSEDIRKIAYKVAAEKIAANIPITDYFNKIAILRTEVINLLEKIEETPVITKRAVYIVNKYMDLYIYFISYKYIEQHNVSRIKEQDSLTETHKERLTLLGQMTSSFVHEFRNPLTSIKGFIQLLKAENPEMKYLDIISGELENLNTRVSQFLSISKKEQLDSMRTVFNLQYLIEEVITFLYPSILDSNVSIQTDVDPLISIDGYPEEIRQVLLNIIFNAVDVLNSTENPLITITGFYTNEKNIMLTISNNGPKIEQDILANIFKPFTTTKKSGTGLGLFVCKEIIEKHNGMITCTSSENLTTFTINIPTNLTSKKNLII